MAVIAALALTTRPWVRRGAVIALVLLGAAGRHDCQRMPPNVRCHGSGCGGYRSPPMRTDWQHAKILALLEQDRRGAPATVSVVPNDNFFAVSNFRYYAVRDGWICASCARGTIRLWVSTT
jgi:hypothetical protein